ncbi:MAG: acyl-CoA dehydrogenase, partial [Thermomicrobiales bacterium]
SSEQTLVKGSAAAFAKAVSERHGSLHRTFAEQLREAGSNGFLSMLAGEQNGGGGLTIVELCLLAEQLGEQLALFPFVHAIAGVMGLSESDGLQATFRLASEGSCAVIPAFQEGPLGESQPLHAEIAGSTLKLSGRRVAVPTAAPVTGFIVDLATGGDIALAYVPREAKGLEVAVGAACDGTEFATLTFRSAEVSAEGIISRGTAAEKLKTEIEFALRMGLAAELLGVAATAHAISLDYLRSRRQFNRLIGSFQALQFAAVDCYVVIEATRSLIYKVATSDGDPDERGALASGVKAKADATALVVTTTGVQLHGALGFTNEHDIGLLLKRAIALRATMGPPAANIARYFERKDRGLDAELPKLSNVAPEDETFRQEVRAWLEANLPEDMRNLPVRPPFEQAMWWHRQLHARGWIAPGWPKKYGGMEASQSQRVILSEEFGRVGAPEFSTQGINHLGPILIAFGTAEQKAQHLPPILTGEKVWCQGYSEPNAGSDLASLRTTAVRDGDHFVVNGQKIWTTWAHYADWMFALVRTDPSAASKQGGITFLLLDMKSPGITRRPIVTIAGEDEFAEVFFDNVRVPVSNVVGAVNEGWRIANALLAHERLTGASPQRCVSALQRLKVAAGSRGGDRSFRNSIALVELDVLALVASFQHAVDLERSGRSFGPEISYMKIASAELIQHIAELQMELAGSNSALADFSAGNHPATTFLQSRRLTILGGTAQVQRSILAKRVLNLPS